MHDNANKHVHTVLIFSSSKPTLNRTLCYISCQHDQGIIYTQNQELNRRKSCSYHFLTCILRLFQCFAYSNYFRIVLTVPEEKMKEACDRIVTFCHDHYKPTPQIMDMTADVTLDLDEKMMREGNVDSFSG